MTTVEELFKGEFARGVKIDKEFTFSLNGAFAFKATARMHLNFQEFVSFISYFVAEEFASLENLRTLIMQVDGVFESFDTAATFVAHPVYDPAGASGHDLPFSQRLILYVDALLPEETKQSLYELGVEGELRLQIRDRSYAEYKDGEEPPLAFICHDSRDKPFVEQVAMKLRAVMCPVWYDDFSLTPGASLRESIDKGLRDSKRCVVFLSPHFLENPGWTKAEFNTALDMHFNAGGKVLIPVWHGVTREQVANYSSLVLDIIAVKSDGGPDKVFRRLHKVLMSDETYE